MTGAEEREGGAEEVTGAEEREGVNEEVTDTEEREGVTLCAAVVVVVACDSK